MYAIFFSPFVHQGLFWLPAVVSVLHLSPHTEGSGAYPHPKLLLFMGNMCCMLPCNSLPFRKSFNSLSPLIARQHASSSTLYICKPSRLFKRHNVGHTCFGGFFVVAGCDRRVRVQSCFPEQSDPLYWVNE